MPYVSGFVGAVPTANKEAYIAHARQAWTLFEKHGALETCECWGDEVPDGEVTSFPMAVKAQPDETVVFAWILWPDKATAQACMASMETDPAWSAMAGMPFDGKRMIFGDFEPIMVARRT
ncbi:MAG: hypothetical protein HLUCCO18_04960 [Rhodobacteraceae bacterium HLUCCO18]|nr:MAG: hypothetical protein HLUCCO18_04960 [Rhodobacteraceae bacterium HLUCCO18]